jgi:hypothetical protein
MIQWIWRVIFQAEAGKDGTARMRSARDTIGGTVYQLDISDERAARKNALDNRQ